MKDGELIGKVHNSVYQQCQKRGYAGTDAKDMHYKILADRVRYFKEDAKGVEAM